MWGKTVFSQIPSDMMKIFKQQGLFSYKIPDPLQNAFDMTKTFEDFPSYRPQFTYIDQLRDIKKEMEEAPMALLWGRKTAYVE